MTCCLGWTWSHNWVEWPCLALGKWDFPSMEHRSVLPSPLTNQTFTPNMTRASVYGLHHGNDLATNPISLKKNRLSEYPTPKRLQGEYEQELQAWIQNGWLILYPEDELGPPKGLIHLMAFVQENKQKVHPVMDYFELNKHVDMYTARADVCAHKLREWWQQGSDVAMLDLCRAYLQIHIETQISSCQRQDWCPINSSFKNGRVFHRQHSRHMTRQTEVSHFSLYHHYMPKSGSLFMRTW